MPSWKNRTKPKISCLHMADPLKGKWEGAHMRNRFALGGGEGKEEMPKIERGRFEKEAVDQG